VTDEVTVAVVPRFEAEMLCEALRGEGIKCGYRITDFGAGMSDGQAHNSYPLSFSVVGGAGGRVKGDRFVIAPEWTPIANVWLGVADMFGAPLQSIGESTGPFKL